MLMNWATVGVGGGGSKKYQATMPYWLDQVFVLEKGKLLMKIYLL